MDNDKLSYEMNAYKNNAKFVCGCDEVGRGCLAGPVVAAAAYISKENYGYLQEIDDSKKITEKKRWEFFDKILDYADVAIDIIQADKIDEINIYEASRKAMEQAIINLQVDVPIDYALTDAMPLKGIEIQHDVIIKGDEKSLSIAAASIVAKCIRDAIMIEYAQLYPMYAFEKHKGYGTKKHMLALDQYGVINGIHRKSYKPIKELLIKQDSLF